MGRLTVLLPTHLHPLVVQTPVVHNQPRCVPMHVHEAQVPHSSMRCTGRPSPTLHYSMAHWVPDPLGTGPPDAGGAPRVAHYPVPPL